MESSPSAPWRRSPKPTVIKRPDEKQAVAAPLIPSSRDFRGSFDRAYAPDGSVFQASAACPGYGAGNNRLSTSDAIPFLVGLYTATNTSQYLNAALRAGQFSLDAIYGPAIFVGGTSS